MSNLCLVRNHEWDQDCLFGRLRQWLPAPVLWKPTSCEGDFWELLSHISVTCESYVSYTWVIFQLRVCHISDICELYFSYMCVTFQLHMSHILVICELYFSYISGICELYFSYTWVTFQLYASCASLLPAVFHSNMSKIHVATHA